MYNIHKAKIFSLKTWLFLSPLLQLCRVLNFQTLLVAQLHQEEERLVQPDLLVAMLAINSLDYKAGHANTTGHGPTQAQHAYVSKCVTV